MLVDLVVLGVVSPFWVVNGFVLKLHPFFVCILFSDFTSTSCFPELEIAFD